MAKQKKTWLITAAILATIILLGLALRLIYRHGFGNPDSFSYVNAAIKLNENGLVDYFNTLSTIYENRISIVIPLALILKTFGLSDPSIMLLPLLYAVGTIVVVYFLGQQLFDVATGLLAALLVATIPLDVFYATTIFPDPLIPFYVGLSLLFFVIGRKRDSRLSYVLSGFFIFCAFQARATSGVLILPLLLTAWWSSRRDVWSLLLPAGAFLAFNLLYWGILFLITGDFFLQLKLFGVDATAEGYVGTGGFLGHFKVMFGVSGDFGLLYLLIFPASFFALYKSWQDEAFRLPVITFFALYLFFEFGSTSLTSYQPIWKYSRFLTILSVPAAVVVAAVAVFLLAMPHYWLRLAVFAVVATHMLLVISLPVFNRWQTQLALDVAYPYKTTFARLAAYDNIETIYVMSPRWAGRGRVFSRFFRRVYHYKSLRNQTYSDIEKNGVVIFDTLYLTPYEEFGAPQVDLADFPTLQNLPAQPPDHWQLLFTVDRPAAPDLPVYVYLVKPETN